MDSREAFRKVYGITTSQLNDELVEYYKKRKFQKVEVFEGIKVPSNVVVEEGSGRRVTVKEKKCTWCTVGKVMRRIPIIIPIP